MNKACYSYDYYYYNHSGKCVCYLFKSSKRVKTKIINFLKKEHEESKIVSFFDKFDLKLEKIAESKQYKQYYIIDKVKGEL